VRLAGVVLTRQQPGTASGAVFLTLEDETGTADVIVRRRVYERCRRAVAAGRLLAVAGRLRREGAVVQLVAGAIEDRSALLDRLASPEGSTTERTRRPAPAGGRGPFPSRDFR
jgi:error-prone DNA polymerase